jgi:hypothetical protein
MGAPADEMVPKAEPQQVQRRPIDRPFEIVLATRSIVVSIVLSLPGLVVALLAWRNSPDLVFKVLDKLIILGFVVWLTLMVYRGYNWARILFLLNYAVGTVLVAPSLIRLLFASRVLFLLYIGQVLALGFATWLILTDPGRRWYQKKGPSEGANAA